MGAQAILTQAMFLSCVRMWHHSAFPARSRNQNTLLLLLVLRATRAAADLAVYTPAETEKLQLSVIDLSKGVGSNAARVLEAGRTHGAFLVVSHGVDAAVIANGLSALEEFVALLE